MKPMRIIVVDDNAVARERLVTLLLDEPGIDVVAACSGGRQAVSSTAALRPDLVFLDVELPDIDGMDVLRLIDPEDSPIVVVVSAHPNYAVKAFEHAVFDYLLKPFASDRLQETLARVKQEILRRLEDRCVDLALELLSARNVPMSPKACAVFPGPVQALRPEDILLVRAAGNYVEIETVAGRRLIRRSLDDVTSELGDRFVRVNRSVLINISRVRRVSWKGSGGEVLLVNGRRQRVVARFRSEIEKRMERS